MTLTKVLCTYIMAPLAIRGGPGSGDSGPKFLDPPQLWSARVKVGLPFRNIRFYPQLFFPALRRGCSAQLLYPQALVLSHQTYIPDSTGSCDLGLRTGDKCLPKKGRLC